MLIWKLLKPLFYKNSAKIKRILTLKVVPEVMIAMVKKKTIQECKEARKYNVHNNE